MTSMTYQIDKAAENGMTTYCVAGMDTANDAAICQALTEAARDAWQYLTARPGSYTAAEMCKTGIHLRDGAVLPAALKTVRVVCGNSTLRVGLVDEINRPNYGRLFHCLSQFEKLARVKQNDRAVFTASMELGALVCEARVVLPQDMKAICDCCGDDPTRPSMSYPALDLDRQCIVATDGALTMAQKIAVASIHYEGKVPETFYMPKEVARMKGEVTVRLYERGCTVIDQKGVEASVEHEARYPKWHTVWPKYRGGMTIVDSKALAKVVKATANSLSGHGKGCAEVVMLNHYAASDGLCIRGYEDAEMRAEQRIGDCIATDEVPYRLTLNAPRLLKALALKPKTMCMGYGENSTLPDRLVLEDMQGQRAILLYHYVVVDLQDALRETEAAYAVTDNRRLHHGYDADCWLLEQVETKFPTCGGDEPTKPGKKKAARKAKKEKDKPVATISAVSSASEAAKPMTAVSACKEMSIADRLREALRARLAA